MRTRVVLADQFVCALWRKVQLIRPLGHRFEFRGKSCPTPFAVKKARRNPPLTKGPKEFEKCAYTGHLS